MALSPCVFVLHIAGTDLMHLLCVGQFTDHDEREAKHDGQNCIRRITHTISKWQRCIRDYTPSLPLVYTRITRAGGPAMVRPCNP